MKVKSDGDISGKKITRGRIDDILSELFELEETATETNADLLPSALQLDQNLCATRAA